MSWLSVHDTETWPWHEVRVHDSETEAHAHALKVSRELGVEVAVIPCETEGESVARNADSEGLAADLRGLERSGVVRGAGEGEKR